MMRRKLGKVIKNLVYIPYDYVAAYFLRLLPANIFVKDILQDEELGSTGNDTVAIFAHFDRDKSVERYVEYYLQKLHKSGIDIVFISNSKKLLKDDVDRIKPFTKKIIIRKGRGRDFASYFLGWELYKEEIKRKYNYLILCNDSVFGPFDTNRSIKFENIIQKLKQKDFSGLTDSYESGYHVQSYFLMFSKKVFDSEMFNSFWRKYKFFNHKRIVIDKYEIGLSRCFVKNKIIPYVLCEYSKVVLETIEKIKRKLKQKSQEYDVEYLRNLLNLLRSGYVNPTHFLWDYLFLNYNFPFIKIELLRDNPSRILNIKEYREIIKPYTTPEEIELIEEYFKRKSKGYKTMEKILRWLLQ